MSDLRDRVNTEAYTTKLPYGPSPEKKVAYRKEDNRLTACFLADAEAYAEAEGVPKKYVSKVVNHAWREGHSGGLSEVVNCLDTLIEIFQ